MGTSTMKALLKKLKEIDEQLRRGWNNKLIKLHKSTWKEYEDILIKKKIPWFQKTRTKWIDNPLDLEVTMTNYFKDVLSWGEGTHPYELSSHFSILDADLFTDLNRGVTDAKILQTIKSIGTFKAPRPNGFQSVFFLDLLFAR